MWERIFSIMTKFGGESLYPSVHAELRDPDVLETLIENGVDLTAKTINGNVATNNTLR